MLDTSSILLGHEDLPSAKESISCILLNVLWIPCAL